MPADLRRRLVTLVAALLVATASTGCTKEFRKNRHLKRGDAYFAEKKYKEAILEYRNVLRFEALSPHAIARLGLSHFNQGELGESLPFLRKAKELNPDDLEVRLRLGTVLLLARQPEKAREDAEFILSKEPSNLGALSLMADTSDSVEELDGAIAAIESKTGDLGDPVKVGRVLGSLYLRKRDVPKAEAAFKQAVAAAPASAEARMSLASLHQAKGESELAEREFKAAANADPDEPARKLRLADFYLQQRKPDEAKRVLGEITARHPDYLPAWLRTAEIAVMERKWDEASKALEPVFKKSPEDRTGLMVRGQIEIAKGKSNEAIQTYQQVVKTNPKFAPARFQLALAQLQAGNAEQAKSELREAVTASPNYADAVFLLADLNIKSGATDVAVEDLNKFIEKFPKVPRAYELLGTAYLRRKEPGKATEAFRKIQEIAPKEQRTLTLLATSLRAEGKNAEARKVLEDALAASTKGGADILGQLVGMDLAEKKPDVALLRAKKQVELYPSEAVLHFVLASVHQARGEIDLAVAEHRKAIELEPRAFGPYRELAQIYARQNKVDDALAQLTKATELAPRDPSLQLLKGILLQQKGDFAQAQQSYESVLALDARSAVAANNLAWIQAYKNKDLEKALALAQKARELAPEDPSVADTLGWILYNRGVNPSALSLLREAAEKQPASAEISYHLGMALLKEGDKDGARRELTKALQGTPTFDGVEDAKKALAGL